MIDLFDFELLWVKVSIVNVLFYCLFLTGDALMFTFKMCQLPAKINFLIMETLSNKVAWVIIINAVDTSKWYKFAESIELWLEQNTFCVVIPEYLRYFSHFNHSLMTFGLHLFWRKWLSSTALFKLVIIQNCLFWVLMNWIWFFFAKF